MLPVGWIGAARLLLERYQSVLYAEVRLSLGNALRLALASMCPASVAPYCCVFGKPVARGESD
jgi:hypothetical protein